MGLNIKNSFRKMTHIIVWSSAHVLWDKLVYLLYIDIVLHLIPVGLLGLVFLSGEQIIYLIVHFYYYNKLLTI